jgi:hypothetical protein
MSDDHRSKLEKGVSQGSSRGMDSCRLRDCLFICFYEIADCDREADIFHEGINAEVIFQSNNKNCEAKRVTASIAKQQIVGQRGKCNFLIGCDFYYFRQDEG